VRWKLEARIPDCGADAIAALTHGGIRKTDHCEVGQPERDVHFDLNGVGVHAEHRGAAEGGEHGN